MGAIRNFLARFKTGDPVRLTANAQNLNRIANILEDIMGVGCRIEKPTDAEGRGWKIVVDGTSDTVPSASFKPPISSLAHTGLTDMPSATVSSHDARYWRDAAHDDPDSKDYHTSGKAQAAELAVHEAGHGSSYTPKNRWNKTDFRVELEKESSSGMARAIVTVPGDEANGEIRLESSYTGEQYDTGLNVQADMVTVTAMENNAVRDDGALLLAGDGATLRNTSDAQALYLTSLEDMWLRVDGDLYVVDGITWKKAYYGSLADAITAGCLVRHGIICEP